MEWFPGRISKNAAHNHVQGAVNPRIEDIYPILLLAGQLMAPAPGIPVDLVTSTALGAGVGGPANSYEWCTGTMVSPLHVLTAAHCVYNISDTHKFVPSLSFSAGKDGSTSPFGTVPWTKVGHRYFPVTSRSRLHVFIITQLTTLA